MPRVESDSDTIFVSSISFCDGLLSPDGWLCAITTLTALFLSAYSAICLGYTIALFTTPSVIIFLLIRKPLLFKRITAKFSFSANPI